jgi:MoxR-like ATPase
MPAWPLYDPASQPSESKTPLPAPPPWRRAGDERAKVVAATFRPAREVVEAVNAALFLRRPLLVTGKPGTGKSSLAYHLAQQLALGPVLRWNIHSRSTLQEGLYQYDALGRLQHVQQQQARGDGSAAHPPDEAAELALFLSLGPLGAALASPNAPRALLIDEIDKSDIDLPNDLLNVLDSGSFEIPELRRLEKTHPEVTLRTGEGEPVQIKGGWVRFSEFPVIVLTSNGERDFPAPFLRRCVQCTIPEPGLTELRDIVAAHFPKLGDAALPLIERFLRERGSAALATDQLLNAQFLLHDPAHGFSADDEDRLLKTVFRSLD